MSSWTFETYSKGNTYVEYRWDKYNGWEMIRGHKVNGVIITDFHNTYISKEASRRAFKRQIRRLEGNE